MCRVGENKKIVSVRPVPVASGRSEDSEVESSEGLVSGPCHAVVEGARLILVRRIYTRTCTGQLVERVATATQRVR